MKPLEPHVLSARLKRSCDEGKTDDAVFMLKNAPLDAQNTQVWNTLIWECLKVKRYQLAYQLFVDVSTLYNHPELADVLLLDETKGFQSHNKDLPNHVQWAVSN
jgi:hypothetical protein